eukprot:TRINITY_DN8637_c0_g1_i2.p1 TRINITY_DN8637_c0_g1~~TRINITY_DN8637_c0_g1_i2.p1  ORF type:complete len:247 (+),score=77.88 TRINITY_DN8637_c0_g1_i2:36-743(+)
MGGGQRAAATNMSMSSSRARLRSRSDSRSRSEASSRSSSRSSSSWRRNRARKLQRQREQEEERRVKQAEYRRFMADFEEWRVKDLEARNAREKEWYSMREAEKIEARRKAEEKLKEIERKKAKKKAKEKEKDKKRKKEKEEKQQKKEAKEQEDLERRSKIAEAIAARRNAGSRPAEGGKVLSDAEAQLAKLIAAAAAKDSEDTVAPAVSTDATAAGSKSNPAGALTDDVIVLDED